MSPQSIYDKLISLCDEYDSLQEKVQLTVEEFNSSDDEGERDNLKKDLSDLNNQIANVGKSFMDEMLKVIDDICKGVNDFIADYKKQRMLSPFNESLDNSKYNRINRLRDLDEYIDSLGCH